MISIFLCLLGTTLISTAAGQCNGANEEFTNCAVTCNTCAWVRDLNELKNTLTCDLDNCSPGCDCKPGFHRSNNGNCVTAKSCLKCSSKPNQYFVAFQQNYCQVSCSLPSLAAISCAPPPDPTNPKYPLGSCRCDTGFVWNKKRQCIKLNQCTANDDPPQCFGDNEVWDYEAGPCDNLPCSWLLNPRNVECDYQGDPRSICRCKDGYYRDANDICTLDTECMCDDPNAHIEDSPSPCAGGTCNKPDYDPCDLVPNKFGCVCDGGFLLNLSGVCTPISQCPRCSGANEEYIQSRCEPTCTYKNRVCATQAVYEDCFCKKGYVRDENKKCIKPSKCRCPSFEVYSQKAQVISKTCANRKGGTATKPGCTCADNLVRRVKGGTCINPSDCP